MDANDTHFRKQYYDSVVHDQAIPSVLATLRPLSAGSCKTNIYKDNQLITLSHSLFVVLLCPWILHFGFPCPTLNEADVSIGDLVGHQATNQSPVTSILTALILSNMSFNVSICIEGYKCRLLLRIPCLTF
ncbi:hypothetical protein G6F46_006945 [Rhizopus delemar]|nr:hypothetical protein G6F55_005612 [Rhizopus delemar]KAG1496696.1 hypothetical protein G6F54_006290 [Rhizopus delemar]KAG1510434.1 hypothetical protein G6F53_006687 [Rhizopus delemar]KAG1554073.1 hypothetical protein G6F49_008166 [Rhizopus delemar]KAG1569099.1 hypothetical protein G6F50_006685 [Rhizopus delemar]